MSAIDSWECQLSNALPPMAISLMVRDMKMKNRDSWFWAFFSLKVVETPNRHQTKKKRKNVWLRLMTEICEFLSFDSESKCKMHLLDLIFPKIKFLLPSEISGAVEISTKFITSTLVPRGASTSLVEISTAPEISDGNKNFIFEKFENFWTLYLFDSTS